MKVFVIATLGLLFAAGAQADETAGRLGACKADVEKLCPDVQPGGGRIIQCLKQHKDEVSAECKARLRQMRDRRGGDGGATSAGASDQ